MKRPVHLDLISRSDTFWHHGVNHKRDFFISEPCDKVSHKNLPGHIYSTKTPLTKEQNEVLFQRQYGVYLINRNAASVTLKCRFRINSIEAYNSF